MIGAFLWLGWATRQPKHRGRYISDEEMREAILQSDEQLRSSILHQADRWVRLAKGSAIRARTAHLLEFLREVWPRQISVKSSLIASKLFRLALCNRNQFDELAHAVVPLLSKIDHSPLYWHSVSEPVEDSGESILKKHPETMLTLLDAVLSDNVNSWPDGVGQVLGQIIVAKPNLATTPTYTMLKRRLDSR